MQAALMRSFVVMMAFGAHSCERGLPLFILSGQTVRKIKKGVVEIVKIE